ncbi:hypothetical protein ACTQ54_01565 [Fundicoccus sp. Sow4_H7]|uniref:hypothetical protein n=1 Tax=Fundicoccus sp. Sow4_H7 TaxID=3438784 RepID=UPI003F90BDAB
MDHRQTSLGRVFDEWIAIGTAFLSVFLYVGTLVQLEPAFILIVIMVIIGLILLKKRNNRIADASYAGKVKNIRQSYYLSNIIGDNRIAKDVRLYQMTEWFEDIKSQLTTQFFQVNKSLKNQQRLENVFITLALILLSAMAYLRSVNLIQTAEIDVSEFVVYVGLVNLVTSTLTNLVTQLSQFNISLERLSSLGKRPML